VAREVSQLRPVRFAGCSSALAVRRAQGGSDFDLDRLVALCPPCHAQTDAPYARGRLVIPRGVGRFGVAVVRGGDKWTRRAQTDGIAEAARGDRA
jgi:hypothetical protein